MTKNKCFSSENLANTRNSLNAHDDNLAKTASWPRN